MEKTDQRQTDDDTGQNPSTYSADDSRYTDPLTVASYGEPHPPHVCPRAASQYGPEHFTYRPLPQTGQGYHATRLTCVNRVAARAVLALSDHPDWAPLKADR